MKAMPFLFAISLAANVVLGWMLWQQHPVHAPDPVVVESVPTEDELLPLPTTPVPLSAPSFLPPVYPGMFEFSEPAPSRAQGRLLDPGEEKPYSAPPPPNANAFPAWQERLPHREPQLQRALLTDPKR